jgi:hypothetical protein
MGYAGGHQSTQLRSPAPSEGPDSPVNCLKIPGVENVGLLPAELQSPTNFSFAAGVMTAAKDPDAARSLINYLTSLPVQSMLKKKGMEPAAAER